ncbi:MAG: hypothetical protein EPN93_03140 [Spirochaetes bacterium]|nr:MAG: hypothetical protein EPN93_03140 [Spirochaetota bacterium]
MRQDVYRGCGRLAPDGGLRGMIPFQVYMLRGRDFSNAGRISSSIKRVLKENKFDPGVIQRIAIITYEAEINLACYTYYGYLWIYFLNDRIKIVVKDSGQGITDIALAMKEGYSTASEEIKRLGFGAGMGLANIKKNSDLMFLHSLPGIGTTLQIEVLLNPDQKREPMNITMEEVLTRTNFTLLTEGIDLTRNVTGGFAGDMLSDVNANSREGNIWITILAHPNGIAVASLKEHAGIIISGGIKPGGDFLERALRENIPVLFSELSTYEVVTILSGLGITANH